MAEIARRVEALRGLGFDQIPRPVSVTPEQARREGLEDLDRTYPEARRRADEQVLKLLGLIDPSRRPARRRRPRCSPRGWRATTTRAAKRMRTLRGAATGTRVLTEMVLAHELTHALEDQRFGLGIGDQGGSDDARARAAGARGGQRLRADVRLRRPSLHARGDARRGARQRVRRHRVAAGFLQAQLVFPYTGGQAFVAALRERAGGRWALVDLAERTRPPVSTEQIMHPEQVGGLRAAAAGADGRRGGARAGLAARVRRGARGVPDARAALAAGGGGSAEAAAGWGGDRYELWRRRGGDADCAPPCRRDAALVVRWRWDTPRDSREFAAKLRQWVRDGLGAVDGGRVAVAERGGAVTLAMAPTGGLARRLAAAELNCGWVGRW